MNIRFGCFFLTAILASAVSKLNAQEFNEELGRQLIRQAIQPEIRHPQQLQPIQNQPKQQQQPEILRISPTTRLPSKYDRIQTLHQPQEWQPNVSLHITNAPPINMRPPGSVDFVFDGRQMRIVTTAGELVVPTGNDISRGEIRNVGGRDLRRPIIISRSANRRARQTQTIRFDIDIDELIERSNEIFREAKNKENDTDIEVFE
jgi:hypothetical protein